MNGAPAAAQPAAAAAGNATPLTDALFQTSLCLNCGTELAGEHCAKCGQKKAGRIGGALVRTEAWSRFRWFEWKVTSNAFRVIPQPGTVAREYVLGKRKDHMHPLSLLLLAIGTLLLVLGGTEYLKPQTGGEAAQKMYELVRSYSKWSFSLGILAAYASTWALFRGRLGYNASELLVLAVYCQAVFVALQIINQLPLLALNTPQAMVWHKRWAPLYMTALQACLLMLACRQFFQLQGWQSAWRLVGVAAIFAALKWAVTLGYARAVVEVVLWQMSV